jgi:hypothetical protein
MNVFAVGDWLRDFVTALFADEVAKRTGGRPMTSSATAQDLFRTLGDQLKPHIGGFGKDDEAAFKQALTVLGQRGEWVAIEIVSARIRALDGLGESSPRFNAFRQMLAHLEDANARADVLLMMSKLSSQGFDDVMTVTGAAYAGKLQQVLPWLKSFALSIPARLKAMDAKAADNIRKLF